MKEKKVKPTTSPDGIPLELSKKQLIGDALGQGGMSLMSLLATTFLMYYFTDVAYIGAGVAGTIFLLNKIVSAISNLGMGILIDKLSFKHGRAKPWLLIFLVPHILVTILLFTIPSGMSMNIKIIWAGAALILFAITSGGLSTPYNALMGLVTRNPLERAQMGTFRASSSFIFGMIVSIAFIPLVTLLGGGQKSYIIVVIVLSVVGGLLIFSTYKTTKESVETIVSNEEKEEKKIPVMQSFKHMLGNKYWLIAAHIAIFSNIIYALQSATPLYYSKYILGDLKYQAILGGITTLPTLICFMVLPVLARKWGIKPLMIFGCILVLVGGGIRILDISSIPFALIGSLLGAVGMVPMMAFSTVLLNNSVDYGEWKTGIRNVGMMNSVAGFVGMFGAAFATAAVGWILSWGGYNGTLSVQLPSAIQSILTVSIYLPLGMSLFILICMLFWQLDKIFPQVVAELHAKRTS